MIAPKKLLKINAANSDMMEFSSGTNFLRVIGEQDPAVDKYPCRKAVFCSGQVYYDLLNERTRSGAKGIALVRLEQLAPFPFNSFCEQIKKYPNAEIIWCQEEPKNHGCWSFIESRFYSSLAFIKHRHREVKYVGRPVSASTATGY